MGIFVIDSDSTITINERTLISWCNNEYRGFQEFVRFGCADSFGNITFNLTRGRYQMTFDTQTLKYYVTIPGVSTNHSYSVFVNGRRQQVFQTINTTFRIEFEVITESRGNVFVNPSTVRIRFEPFSAKSYSGIDNYTITWSENLTNSYSYYFSYQICDPNILCGLGRNVVQGST